MDKQYSSTVPQRPPINRTSLREDKSHMTDRCVRLARGVFTVSIDLELAWGIWDHLRPGDCAAIRRERVVVERLVSLFELYELSATWAVVGSLLEQEPLLPDNANAIGASDLELWSGIDIVQRIKSASPMQEIGSHSYGHRVFDEKVLRTSAALQDIENARRLHENHEMPFRSFVFPRNVVGFRRVLSDAGITTYRGVTNHWYLRAPWRFWKVTMLLNYLLGCGPPTVVPSLDEYGMVNLPDSMLLLGRDGVRSIVPARNVQTMAMAGLDRAAATKEVFHLWFHPSNLTYDMERQLSVLEHILAHAARLRRAGLLSTRSMGQVQEDVTVAGPGLDRMSGRRMTEV